MTAHVLNFCKDPSGKIIGIYTVIAYPTIEIEIYNRKKKKLGDISNTHLASIVPVSHSRGQKLTKIKPFQLFK